MTCVYCGADAVDASGVCQACGRRAAGASAPHHDSQDTYESADTTAETREADIPLPARRVTAAPPLARQSSPQGSPATPAPRGGDRGAAGPRSGVQGGSGVRGGSGVYGGAAPSTNRYCGTCGAEIEPGMQFCGQCGTPVAAGFDNTTYSGAPRRGTYPPATRSAYAGDSQPSYDEWSPANQDAPTEQFTPPYAYPHAPYRQSGSFGPRSQPAETGGGLSREMRAFLGILCILGALISGAGAIILAFIH